MNRNTKIGFIVGIIAVMFLVVWLFSGGDEGTTTDGRKPYVSTNWSKKFQLYDKNPLGLYLFTSLTNVHLDGQHELVEIKNWMQFDTIIDNNSDRKTFMFVGNNFGLQTSEVDTILQQVEKGSDLFLSFNSLTDNLSSKLLEGLDFHFDYSEEINIFSKGGKYKMINLFQTDTIACEWNGIRTIDDDLKNAKSLSSFMEMSNFVRLKVGEGNVYIHTTPTCFYNYQIKRLHGFKYTEFVLNHFAKDRDVYLLELGRLSDNYGNYDIESDEEAGGKEDDSYLTLIFRNPTLLTALLLSILGVILFVIFRSKRTRPVVPFVPEKKDMTLAFAETITSIYFAKRNPYGLLQVQRKNFYANIHRHFFVELQRREDDRPIEILAEKSNMRKEDIKKLINKLETKEASSVTDIYVSEMLKEIHHFYKQVGIISEDLIDKVKERQFVFRRAIWHTFSFVFEGLSFCIVGIYLLMISTGVGILLLPIGFGLLIIGGARMSYPMLVIEGKEMIFRTQLGKKKIFKAEDLIQTEMRKNGVIFHFRNKRKLIINYRNMSVFDREQFKTYVSKLNTLEL